MLFYNLQGKRQGGAALFLVLIAVALFAALSYAVTSSSRGGGNVRKETSSLTVAEILQYAGLLQQAINRLVLINGCTIMNDTGNTISFQTNPSSLWGGTAGYNNGLGACNVFDPAGGDVAWRLPPPDVQATGAMYAINRNYTVNGIGTNGVNNDDPAGKELLLLAHVPLEVCVDINKRAGIAGPNPPSSAQANLTVPAGASTAFAGAYGVAGSHLGFATTVPAFAGKTMGCFFSTAAGAGGGKYSFYYVLVER